MSRLCAALENAGLGYIAQQTVLGAREFQGRHQHCGTLGQHRVGAADGMTARCGGEGDDDRPSAQRGWWWSIGPKCGCSWRCGQCRQPGWSRRVDPWRWPGRRGCRSGRRRRNRHRGCQRSRQLFCGGRGGRDMVQCLVWAVLALAPRLERIATDMAEGWLAALAWWVAGHCGPRERLCYLAEQLGGSWALLLLLRPPPVRGAPAGWLVQTQAAMQLLQRVLGKTVPCRLIRSLRLLWRRVRLPCTMVWVR